MFEKSVLKKIFLGAIQIICDTLLSLFCPPPSCAIFLVLIPYFRPKLLWNIKCFKKKVFFEALSCHVTKCFTSKSIKDSTSKKGCVTFCPPPNSECHVFFEWPLNAKSHEKITIGMFRLILCHFCWKQQN